MNTTSPSLLRRSWQSWLSRDMERSGPYALQLLWTGLFAAALAVVFTALGFLSFARTFADWLDVSRWVYWLGKNLLSCLIISYTIHALFELGAWLVGGPTRMRRFTGLQGLYFFAGIPLLGVALGWPLAGWLIAAPGFDLRGPQAFRVLAWGMGLSLLTTFVLYHWFGAKAQAIDAERRATQAQLRLLQAQMEPHFLFNTLANVHGLVDHDPVKAKAMLGAFTDYLRASLATLRRETVPLAAELELAQAYLQVQAVRMEDRLRFRIDADAATRTLQLPPLLLQPLVENAVQHGLEPTLQGGEVVVTARSDGAQLLLEVRDSGQGLQAASRKGAGVALANIRERLASQFGAAASLELLPATASGAGTLARLRVPASAYSGP